MATRGWLFVLFVIVTEVAWSGTNTSPSDSPAEHDCTVGLRHVDDGLLIYKDALTGHWNPPNRAAMECLQLALDRQKKSLKALRTLLDSIETATSVFCRRNNLVSTTVKQAPNTTAASPTARYSAYACFGDDHVSVRPADCGEIFRSLKGRMNSGIYTIYPRASGGGDNSASMRVFCRVGVTGAWTVIQRRQDGSVDFYNRTWEDYSRGFGSLTGEFWLGNDNIHLLTNQGRYKLYVDYRRFKETSVYSEYACFRVENEQNIEDCPKESRNKMRGILNFKFIEMKISESGITGSSKGRHDVNCNSG
ncbi:angiopoietin-2-like [Branchiostoma floridae x Branchiostoma japonicum]